MANPPAITEQYHRTLAIGGVLDDGDQSALELTGPDRVRWLDNLVTNAVAPLTAGQAAYALALNVKGRILADLHILVLPDRLRLHVDRRVAAALRNHLERHLITEDVAIRPVDGLLPAVALLGPRAADALRAAGLADAAALPPLHHTVIQQADGPLLLLRRRTAGLPAFEVCPVAADGPPAAVERIRRAAAGLGFARLSPAGRDILRIESGEPRIVDDFDETTLALETGLQDRAVCRAKGCYLGQEIVERMWSRGAAARRIAAVAAEGETPPAPGSPVLLDGREVGRTRSGCWSEALGGPLSLAILKAEAATPGAVLTVTVGPEGPDRDVPPHRTARVVATPVRG